MHRVVHSRGSALLRSRLAQVLAALLLVSVFGGRALAEPCSTGEVVVGNGLKFSFCVVPAPGEANNPRPGLSAHRWPTTCSTPPAAAWCRRACAT